MQSNRSDQTTTTCIESLSHAEILEKAAFSSAISFEHNDPKEPVVLPWLRAHPEFLFVEGKTRDCAGRQIKGSIYQILLGNLDVWALENIHEKIIPTIQGGYDLAVMQYKEQFPHYSTSNGTEDDNLYSPRNTQQIADLKACLDKIVAAFDKDKCPGCTPTEQATIEAISKMREILTIDPNEVISTGLHFPLKLVEMVQDIYDDKFYSAWQQTNGWNESQLVTYSFEVIGLIQQFATSIAAMCYTNGLKELDYRHGPVRTNNYYALKFNNPTQQFPRFFVDVYLGGHVSSNRLEASSEPCGALSTGRLLTQFFHIRDRPMPELRKEITRRIQSLFLRTLKLTEENKPVIPQKK